MRDDRCQITILVADDDQEARVLMRTALLTEGLASEVEFANDGEELMNMLARPRLPDLIVLDLQMPKKDGWQALREIRCDERLREIPVVIMSGRDTDEDRQFAREQGVEAYLVKPETLPGLFKAVRGLRSQVMGN
jgi:CheY-like chemotaxis protein